MYELTGGRVPIIGCGGVSSGVDVYDKIKGHAAEAEDGRLLGPNTAKLEEISQLLERY